MSTESQLSALLELMDQWENIEAELNSRGMRGFAANQCACPVARFLSEQVGRQVAVGHTVAYVVDSPACVTLPHSVQDFIGAFDDGKYPHLEMDHSEVGAYI